MPLKSFQMELAKGLLLNSASILVPIKCLLLKGMPAWWSCSKAQGALLPTLPFQVLLRDFSPGWAGRLLSLGGLLTGPLDADSDLSSGWEPNAVFPSLAV